MTDFSFEEAITEPSLKGTFSFEEAAEKKSFTFEEAIEGKTFTFEEASKPEKEPQIPLGVRGVIGLGETVAKLGTGLASQVVGGLKAIGELATGEDVATATESIEDIAEKITIEPKTKVGKQFTKVVEAGLEQVQKGIQAVGQTEFEAAKRIEDLDLSSDDKVKTELTKLSFQGLFGLPQLSPVAAGTITETTLNAMLLGIPFLKGKKGAAKVAETIVEEKIEAKAVGAEIAEQIKEPDVFPRLESAKEILSDTKTIIRDVTGGKAITPIRDLGERSPTAKKLADAIEPPEIAGEAPTGRGYYEAISRETGRFVTAIEEITAPVRSKITDTLSGINKRAIVNALRGETPANATIGKISKDIRKVLDDVRTYANNAGLEIGFVKDYVPRIYRKSVLKTKKGRNDFIDVLMKRGIDATDADLIVERIIRRDGILEKGEAITADATGKVREAFGRVRGRKTAPETSRTLARIPDKELAPFLENDLNLVLSKYIPEIVQRAEWARIYGKGGGKLDAMLSKITEEARQAGRPLSSFEQNRIIDLANAMQRTYRPIQIPTGRLINNFAIVYQYIRTLPLATLSSITEPLVILLRGRPKSAVKAIPETIDHVIRSTVRIAFKGVKKAEATKALENIGIGLDAALSERMQAAFGATDLGAVGQTLSSAWFKAIGLHQWTRFNRVLSNETGKIMVVDNLRDIARGKRVEKRTRELIELGIDPKEGAAWFKRGASKTDPFYENVIIAGLRFTNETVMNPRASVRPLWHSNPHYQVLAQLKGFQTVFGNTVVKRMYQEIAKRNPRESAENIARMAVVSGLMVSVAMLMNELREQIKYGPRGNPRNRNEPIEKKIIRGIDRSGFTGVVQLVLDSFMAHRFGSEPGLQILGPTATQANEIIKGIGLAAEGNPRVLANAASKAIPIINVIPKKRKEISKKIQKVLK